MGWVRAVLALAAASATLVAAQAAPAAFPAAHERLLYTAESTLGGTATFAVDPSGGAPRMLVAPISIGVNGAVSVSPNGTRIAYTDTIPFDFSFLPPSFRGKLHTPNYPLLGYTKVEFESPSMGGVSVQFGGNQVGGVYSRPAWSPDGKRLAVSQGTPGQLQLYEIGTATNAQTLVTAGLTGDSIDARWSPDGAWIAFTERNGTNSQLYLVHADGTGLHKLSDGTAEDKQPDFSPDGQQIVFSSNRTGTWQLYVVPTAGGSPVRLVTEAGDDTNPAWSPDGQWIAYSNENGELHTIAMVDAAGRNQRVLSTSPSVEVVQDWQPVLHTGNPTVQALPSSGQRGKPISLRYRASDSVPISVSFSYSVSAKGAADESGGNEFNLTAYRSQAVRRTRAGPLDLDQRLLKQAKHISFCIYAHDAWGNGSASCSTYRFVS